VKVNVYLTDLKNFAAVNEAMTQYFKEPFPARAAIGVAQLPRGAQVEVDAVLVL
jgi:enamine deaminase RidA (YjgF/YER057c/UK114 family)